MSRKKRLGRDRVDLNSKVLLPVILFQGVPLTAVVLADNELVPFDLIDDRRGGPDNREREFGCVAGGM